MKCKRNILYKIFYVFMIHERNTFHINEICKLKPSVKEVKGSTGPSILNGEILSMTSGNLSHHQQKIFRRKTVE